MAAGLVLLQGVAALVGLYAAYAYLLRFERLVLGRLGLRGDARWGVVWPLVVALRALCKPVALPSGWKRVAAIAGPLFSAGAPLGAFMLLCRGALVGGLALIVLAPAGVLLGGLGSLGQESGRRALRTAASAWMYALPVLLALGGTCMLAGAADLGALQEGQRDALPFLVYQPLGVLVMGLAAVLGSRYLAVQSPELGAALMVDFHLQYAGWTYALYHWAGYLHVMALSTLMALAYLGGAAGPGGDGLHWLVLKSALVATALLWFRQVWAYPRGAQLGRRLWVLLVAIAAGNLLLTAALHWPWG
ncbi:MAG: NADH-quinone oxidoreductase subunit H [Anaerolineae bacterium]